MKNNEFIKKYGIQNLYSIMESVRANLAALYYGKKIPKYKVNNRKKQVKFYINGKFLIFDIAEIYYMSDKKIIMKIKKMESRC